jgi:DNA-binding HxlR family transcriptional regulator
MRAIPESPQLHPADLPQYCPYFHHVVELIGRRWSGAILMSMAGAPRRFVELREAVPGLSDRLLTERLAELTDEGLVERLDETGGVSRYRLSPHGEELRPILEAIGEFAHAHFVAGSCAVAEHAPRPS